MCNQLAYELERASEHSLALQLYIQSHLPPARERRIRLLEKQGDFSAAWQLLNELLQTPYDEHELQVAQRMAPRLAKKLGEAVAALGLAEAAKPLRVLLGQILQGSG